MYFDEDMILDIRLNTLNEYVSKFIICESRYNHKGVKKKLNFNIKSFKKFENKIKYIVLENLPKNLHEIKENDSEKIKNSKILDNALMRENYQRNYCSEFLKDYSENDLVLINDIDEIPNLENFKYKCKITFFIQKMFYYKLNLEYPNFDWIGSRICKVKHLKSPQWLRNIKPKKYSFWRPDVLLSSKKYSNVEFIKSGGWHFTNVKTVEQIDHKMRNFLHHLEYEKSGININDLKNLIDQKKIMYNHKADKTDQNKWKNAKSLNKISLIDLPNYVRMNSSKFKDWLD
tara:strand:- start:4057 stop:4920 length:864 start_codon:yes stop_codon:yes gene_type:complete